MQSVFFFLLRSVGRRDLSAGPEQKKNTTQGLFFCSGPGERQGKEKPRWKPARGQSKKKKHHPGCFFVTPCRCPTGLHLPLPFPGAGAKKKTPWVVFFFFALAPCRLPTGLLLPLPFAGAAAKKNTLGGVFFFLLWPRAGFQRGFSFPCLSPGPQQKKKTPWVVFFFLLRPRADAHSLTAGLGGDASPSPGRCFFFCCGPARTGVVLFFCCGPARTLTHSRWAGAISARPGWCFFFLLRPRRVFLDNSKKCLGYYIGSKKTRRGHSKKKHHFLTKSLEPFNIYTQARSQFRRSQTLNPKPRILQKPIPTIPAGCRSQPPTPWFLKGMGEWAIKTS